MVLSITEHAWVWLSGVHGFQNNNKSWALAMKCCQIVLLTNTIWWFTVFLLDFMGMLLLFSYYTFIGNLFWLFEHALVPTRFPMFSAPCMKRFYMRMRIYWCFRSSWLNEWNKVCSVFPCMLCFSNASFVCVTSGGLRDTWGDACCCCCFRVWSKWCKLVNDCNMRLREHLRWC